MESLEIKKHWWYWVSPIFWSVVLCWTIIAPLIYLPYAFLRWKLDKIEIKDGCLCSRLGIISIDKKTIPLDQISYIGEKTNIIAQSLGFGDIQVQCSAFAEAIAYPCIANAQELIQYVNEFKSKK